MIEKLMEFDSSFVQCLWEKRLLRETGQCVDFEDGNRSVRLDDKSERE